MAYVGSPYNFIPFSEHVHAYPKETLPAHDAVSHDGSLLSGYIDYSMTAQTPIFVGSGSETFYKNSRDQYAIPGSTVRGLIRSNAQILSFSSFLDDIADYALMYRRVGAPKSDPEQKRYDILLGANQIDLPIPGSNEVARISYLANVRAGYLVNTGNGFLIYDTTVDQVDKQFGNMNYYILTERQISKAYQSYLQTQRDQQSDQDSAKQEPFSYSFFFTDDTHSHFKTQNILRGQANDFIKQERTYNNKTFVSYRGRDNSEYTPYCEPCTYEVNGRMVIKVGNLGEYKNSGYVVSTGKIYQQKKAVYIIPAKDMEKASYEGYTYPIAIPENSKELKAFKIDFNSRATTLTQFGGKKGKEAFSLPAKGEERVVFYFMDGDTLYFGFTPHLRLYYDHTIHDGIPKEQEEIQLDYAKALFGFSSKDASYRSRVSFSDALISKDNGIKHEDHRILAEPKPTSLMDYLEPQDSTTAASYNNDDFKLRGIKQYWVRKGVDNENSIVPEDKWGELFVTRFIPLDTGTEFAGKVRFHNLKPEELGLLLWSMHLSDYSYLNLGKAKAFGYGTVDLQILGVNLIDNNKAFDLSQLRLDIYKNISEEEWKGFIKQFKDIAKEISGRNNPERDPSIDALLTMKDSRRIPDHEKIRQMHIGNSQQGLTNEFKNRTPLPRPADIANPAPVDNSGKQVGNEYIAIVKDNKQKLKFYIEDIDSYGTCTSDKVFILQSQRRLWFQSFLSEM